MKKFASALIVMLAAVVIMALVANPVEKSPTAEKAETSVQQEEKISPPPATNQAISKSDEAEKQELLTVFRDVNDDIKTKTARVKQIIKQNAIEKWTESGVTDWEMVDYVCEKQEDALSEYLSLVRHSDFEGTINEELLMAAFLDWNFDFEMVMYVYENQMDAWEKRN